MALRERGRWVRDHLPGSGRLLDVGCHAALDTAAWASRADAVFGVDVDPAVLHAPDPVKRAMASAAQLPFRAAAFDVVTFVEVLEHLPPALERPALEEIRRVLRDDGRLILTTPHLGWFAWLDPMDVKRRLGLQPGKGHKHFSLREIETLLDGLFTVEELHLSSLVLHPISTWLGLGNSGRWLRFRSRLSDWDYNHQFGRASFNLALVARPLTKMPE